MSYFVKSIAMASNSSSESSRESSLTHFPMSVPLLDLEMKVNLKEYIHSYNYEHIIASGSDEGGTSDLSEDISPRLLNLNVLIFK